MRWFLLAGLLVALLLLARDDHPVERRSAERAPAAEPEEHVPVSEGKPESEPSGARSEEGPDEGREYVAITRPVVKEQNR